MVRLFVRHTVADYAKWRKVYDAFHAKRLPMGVTDHAVYRAVDNPNDVTVWHDFADAKSAQAFMGSQELRAAMSEAGVSGPPTVWLTNSA